MFIISYRFPSGEVKYRKDLKFSKREDATLYTFEEAYELVKQWSKDALRVWRVIMIMEDCDDNSSEEPGSGVQDRTKQVKNDSKSKIRKKQRSLAVGGEGSSSQRDPLLINYNMFGNQTFKPLKKRPDYLDDETILIRIDLMRRVQTNELGLEEPFPSPPFRNPKYSIRHTESDDDRFFVVTWMTLYACKHAVALMIRGQKFTWLNSKVIQTEDGRKIKSDDLEKIMEHELTDQERKWIMPEPVRSRLAGEKLDLAAHLSVPQKMDKFPNSTAGVDTRATRKSNNRAAQVSTGGKGSGEVTPGTIAAELNMTPQQIRAALRRLKIPKPYAWNRSTGDEIADKIRGKKGGRA